MRIATLTEIGAWHPYGILFDLRELAYEWGNNLFDIFNRGSVGSGIGDLPHVTVVSEKSRKGFLTSIENGLPVVEDFEIGLALIVQLASKYISSLRSDDT